MKLLEFLQSSAATPAFAAAVHRFLESGLPNEQVSFGPGSPPVKVERTLTKLLETHRDLHIESVEIDGRSGCEFFRGALTVRASSGDLRIDFDWDCRWRAEDAGWRDYFGFPDQIRAAREFGHDCFRGWEPRPMSPPAPSRQAIPA